METLRSCFVFRFRWHADHEGRIRTEKTGKWGHHIHSTIFFLWGHLRLGCILNKVPHVLSTQVTTPEVAGLGDDDAYVTRQLRDASWMSPFTSL